MNVQQWGTNIKFGQLFRVVSLRILTSYLRDAPRTTETLSLPENLVPDGVFEDTC